MDLSKELKIMLSNSSDVNNSLVEELVKKQKEEQRLFEEKIHILMVVKLTESLRKFDFKSLSNCGVKQIRLYVVAPGSNAYRPDLLKIKFIHGEKQSSLLAVTEENLIRPMLDMLETGSGTKLYHRYTNKFANMYIDVKDSIEDIEEQILTALLAPHLKEILKSNKMNVQLQNELSVNENIRTNKTKI
jgi:hypothetical protein